MKKSIYKILIAVFIFAIYGCSPAEDKTAELNSQTNEIVTEDLAVDSLSSLRNAEELQEGVQMEQEINALSDQVDSLLQDI